MINSLYEEIKQDLAEAMLFKYPCNASVRVRTKHIWNKYVEWGLENPEQLAVVHKIKAWEGLKEEVREATTARFADLHLLTKTADQPRSFSKHPR